MTKEKPEVPYLFYNIGGGPVYTETTARSINAAKTACTRALPLLNAPRIATVAIKTGPRSFVPLAVLRPARANVWTTTPEGLGFECWRRQHMPNLSPIYFPAWLKNIDDGERLTRWRYKWFGQPRAGEYFVSGSIPEIYRASNNLSSFVHIVELAG